jgi:hypothetical protein
MSNFFSDNVSPLTKSKVKLSHTMKLCILTGILGFALFVNSPAKIGETPLELVARYGNPSNPFALMMGFAEWDTQQGSVIALINNGSAQLMAYRGGLTPQLVNELLERNLPKGQKWVESQSAKAWVVSKHVEPGPEDQYFQTTDGSLWAIKAAEADTLTIGTPDALGLAFKLHERFSND